MKKNKPFGLAFLSEVPADQLAQINGGHKKKKHHGGSSSSGSGSSTGSSGSGSTSGGGTFTTQFVSLPQPAFPTGDHG